MFLFNCYENRIISISKKISSVSGKLSLLLPFIMLFLSLVCFTSPCFAGDNSWWPRFNSDQKTSQSDQLIYKAKDSAKEPSSNYNDTPKINFIEPSGNYPENSHRYSNTVNDDYVLDTGDKIRVTVYGEPDLSGEFVVSSTGEISLPLIDSLNARKTIGQLQNDIRNRLADGYLKNPRISLEVLNYRPFFILGEVMDPGSYAYVSDMTVMKAVSIAGGYTYRANKSKIKLKRGKSNKEIEVDEQTRVLPGDVIEVPQRFF